MSRPINLRARPVKTVKPFPLDRVRPLQPRLLIPCAADRRPAVSSDLSSDVLPNPSFHFGPGFTLGTIDGTSLPARCTSRLEVYCHCHAFLIAPLVERYPDAFHDEAMQHEFNSLSLVLSQVDLRATCIASASRIMANDDATTSATREAHVQLIPPTAITFPPASINPMQGLFDSRVFDVPDGAKVRCLGADNMTSETASRTNETV